MFTGIIEEIGTVRSIKKSTHSAALTVKASKVLDGLNMGDSIAVNGVCLTVVSITNSLFSADVMHETVNRSNLWNLKTGDMVNLERAVMLNGRLGGHIVSGHIDGIGVIRNIKKDENAVWFTIRAPKSILRYVVEKGSVAIDGVSLTVTGVTENDFGVSVIPNTVKCTALGKKHIGDVVNLENDCVGKYVEKLLRTPAGQSSISRKFLAQYGI
ncbi:MAG TPA: riboflavin synthase [Ruminococcaceae bacterium]|jgi:riboflavin synthase|nr:riboflavin synthase [Oscillospiraceae bacterium]